MDEVKFYIANTDKRWFDFLHQRSPQKEVNFWQPSDKKFRAVSKGELIVFRLKKPLYKIGGFGVLSSVRSCSIQSAWDAFGEGNGVSSLEEFIDLIQKNRDNKKDPANSQTPIRCRVLDQPIFLNEDHWLESPPSWSKNIVSGKTYSANEPEGKELWMKLNKICAVQQTEPNKSEQDVKYALQLIKTRPEQRRFSDDVRNAYNHQCALTGCDVRSALEAAHIKPHAKDGENSLSNGILLRRDIHGIFDAGDAMIDEDYRFVLSENIRTTLKDGDEYLHLHGRRLRLPDNKADHPSKEYLRLHAKGQFKIVEELRWQFT